MSNNKLEIFPQKDYKEIVDAIGKFRYFMYEKGETLPGNLFQKLSYLADYSCVVAGTGSTLTACVIDTKEVPQGIVIPQDGQVVIARRFRYDDRRGEPHFNADDQLIFPTQKGDILRMARKDAPDHFIKICQASRILTLAEAYKLPTEKSGPIENYGENGAKLPVVLKSKK